MGLKIRMVMLLCLVAAAALSGYGAYSSIRRTAESAVPEEVYAQLMADAEDAEFFLRSDGSHVAVYSGARGRTPVSVTGIEVSGLRSADRAMLDAGIPVADRETLLYLLEDLGS